MTPEDKARLAANEDVLTDVENLIESLSEAAEVLGDNTLADRYDAWSVVLEAIRNEASRTIGSIKGRERRELIEASDPKGDSATP